MTRPPPPCARRCGSAARTSWIEPIPQPGRNVSPSTTAAAPTTVRRIAYAGPSPLGWPTLYPSVGGVVPAGRPPEEVVCGIRDRDTVAGRARSGRGDPAGRVQPLNPGRAGQAVAVGAGGGHDCLQEKPVNVPGPAGSRRFPRRLDRAAVVQLPYGTPGGEVQEVSADRLRGARRLVEGGLGIGKQPGAVPLARVLLDADRVDDKKEPAVRSVRPRIEWIARRRLRCRPRGCSSGEQTAQSQHAGTRDDEPGKAARPFHVDPLNRRNTATAVSVPSRLSRVKQPLGGSDRLDCALPAIDCA